VSILQISLPRSGGYLLWKTIESILDASGAPRRSLVRGHPIQARRHEFPEVTIDLFSVDSLTVTEHGMTMDVDAMYSEPVVDLDGYLAACDHVWSDFDAIPQAMAALRRFRRIILLTRDPRDVLVSTSQFAMTPYWRRYRPHPHRSAAEFLAGNLEELATRWRDNADSYLAVRAELGVMVVRYEDFATDLPRTVPALADALGVRLEPATLARIADEVSLPSIARQNPALVQVGAPGRHREVLDGAQLAAM
jgi:hypothetical protein